MQTFEFSAFSSLFIIIYNDVKSYIFYCEVVGCMQNININYHLKSSQRDPGIRREFQAFLGDSVSNVNIFSYQKFQSVLAKEMKRKAEITV